MSLHIGINLCPYTGSSGGAETYLKNLVAALARIGCPHRISLVIASGMAGRFSTALGFEEIVCGRVGQSRPRRVWLEQAALPKLIRRHGIDLIFSNYVSPVRARCRQIVNVHDLLYKVYPQHIPGRAKLWYWRLMVPASIRRAETVLTVSGSSAHDIRRFFAGDAHKVVVGSEAVSTELAGMNSPQADSELSARLGVAEPYMLCTAGLDGHKNIRTLVRAFEAVAETRRDLTLVLTDPQGRTQTDALDGVRADVRTRIILTGWVPCQQLAALYRRAVAHVTPSRFEGFGLPVVEAQHFGCPNIVSLAGSLPEVAGDGALFFHPDDPATLAAHLRALLADERRRQDLIALGRGNLRRYNWDAAARQFLELCERPPRRPAPVRLSGKSSWYPPVKQVIGFGRRGFSMKARVRKLPLLILMPHSGCNCRCVMCEVWKDNANCRELSVEQVRAWRRTFEKLGVRRVMLTGGEPLMHGDVERLLGLLHESGLQTTLLSSGLLLRRYARAIVEHCADVVVSLDGSQAVHDAIRRVPGAFDKLADGVAALRALDPLFPVTGRCTIQRANFRDWPGIIDAAREIGLRSISFQAADVTTTAFNHPQGWEHRQANVVAVAREELSALTNMVEQVIRTRAAEIESGFIAERPEALRRIAYHFAALRGESVPVAPRCNVPWVSAVVEADGSVRPCFFHRALGNINDAPLADVLNSDEMVRFRKTLSVQDDPTCRRCTCSLFVHRKGSSTPSPVRRPTTDPTSSHV